MFKLNNTGTLIIDPDLLAIPQFKIIWESDYLKNKETIINECISKINTLIKGKIK